MANKRGWLKSKHDIYRENEEQWRINERRLRGGSVVLDELTPFDWEKQKDKKGSYAARQKEATYVNFMDLHGAIIAGHMMRESPSPKSESGEGALDFGNLGIVDGVDGPNAEPTRAAQIYANVDGTGRQSSQWDPWWLDTFKRAMGTGHRWLFMDVPSFVGTPTRADELRGIRPYIVQLSPLSVPQWHEEDGKYQFFIIKLKERVFQLDEHGDLKDGGKMQDVYLLLVREGFTGLNHEGDDFSGGGWWKFDKDGEYLMRPVLNDEGRPTDEVEPQHGDWELTDGEIPMWPIWAERDDGDDEHPSMSRAPLQSLGQVAVSYMNLSSAADYDAWDAGQSQMFITGIEPEDHAAVVEQWKGGSKILGIPLVRDHEGKTHVPSVQDGSMGAVAAGVWEKRLQNKWEEARILAALEATGDPNTSGVSKQMSFRDIMAPRLANYAANLEAAQNTAIYFFERMFGLESTGTVIWPREFNLKDVMDDINTVFAMENAVGFRNREFDADLLVRAAEELALITDPKQRQKVLDGYKEAARTADDTAAQAASAFANAGITE